MALKDFSINELTGIKYECSCGMTHSVDIDMIDISYDAMENAAVYAGDLEPGLVQILCDENTYEIAAGDFSKRLTALSVSNTVHVIHGRHGHDVAPNDEAIGETLARMDVSADLFVAVGSGVINDITRQVSYKMGKPYFVIATAPSMDGYASVTSSLILNNVKESIQGQYPRAIFGPLDILKNAPYTMITAGFGDVIGKYNAIREWQFGRDYKNEHYCSEIAGLVEKVVDKCKEGAENLRDRSDDAISDIMEALVLAGMAMGLYRNTRPASGAEHHIVHYWDVDCIRRGEEHELHGNSVGIGTVVICRLFDLLKGRLPVDVGDVDYKMIIDTLNAAGCMTKPQEAGISRELFKESILKGQTMSSKYTVLTYLSKEAPELLEETAEKLCKEFYGE